MTRSRPIRALNRKTAGFFIIKHLPPRLFLALHQVGVVSMVYTIDTTARTIVVDSYRIEIISTGNLSFFQLLSAVTTGHFLLMAVAKQIRSPSDKNIFLG